MTITHLQARLAAFSPGAGGAPAAPSRNFPFKYTLLAPIFLLVPGTTLPGTSLMDLQAAVPITVTFGFVPFVGL